MELIVFSERCAVLLHGLFYTLPLIICMLLNTYAAHMFVQLSDRLQLLALLVSGIASFSVVWLLSRAYKNVLVDTLVTFFWIAPQVVLLFPYFLKFIEHELYFFLIDFPYAHYSFWLNIAYIIIPLVLLLQAGLRRSELSIAQALTLCVAYPLFLFLDIYAGLLGFFDYLLGKRVWRKIERTHTEDSLLLATGRGPAPMFFRLLVGCFFFVVLLIAGNDLTAEANCGEPRSYLYKPLIFLPSERTNWRIEEVKELEEDGTLRVRFINRFSGALSDDAHLRQSVDGRSFSEQELGGAEPTEYVFETKAGWASHTLTSFLENDGVTCRRRIPFTSTHKVIEPDKFIVNGEAFIVKGIVPSFSPIHSKLSVAEGLRQLKELEQMYCATTMRAAMR